MSTEQNTNACPHLCSFVYSIRKLMEAAHELGKKGEPLEFEEVDTTPADEE